MNTPPTKSGFRVYADSRLHDILVADAYARGIPVSEAAAQAIAKAYGRLDLAAVPRKPLGRRRNGQRRMRAKKGKMSP